jgi:hypothetical protein
VQALTLLLFYSSQMAESLCAALRDFGPSQSSTHGQVTDL